MSRVIFHVCLRCALMLGLTVRELIGHAIRPFSPSVLCWCP